MRVCVVTKSSCHVDDCVELFCFDARRVILKDKRFLSSVGIKNRAIVSSSKMFFFCCCFVYEAEIRKNKIGLKLEQEVLPLSISIQFKLVIS